MLLYKIFRKASTGNIIERFRKYLMLVFMKIILEKFFHAQKWKNTLLAGCFIFIAAFNLWQIFGNNLGYANNGSFNKYVNSNGLAFVKTPEYYFFSDPVNYRVVASPERRKLINSADAVVRLTLPLAKLNKNIFDLKRKTYRHLNNFQQQIIIAYYLF